MEQPPSPPNAHQAEQYQLIAGSDVTQFQRNFLTEEEEHELASTSNRQERRRIQNRVAQRAYRQKQKRRLQELEERLTSGDVGYTPPPEVEVEALRRSGGFDEPNTWSSLATSYPIATTLTTHMSRGPQAPASVDSSLSTRTSARDSDRYPLSGDTIDQLGLSLRTTLGNQHPQSVHAVGYIQPAAADIQDDITPFMAISILPVRIAVLMNLEIMGIGLQQYRSNNATSPFLNGQFMASGSQTLPLERVISALASSAPCLVPTRLQLEVEHHPYIDTIPAGAVRDRILEALLNEATPLDQEELCRDIERGLRVWGKTPWDERCWEWSTAFVDNWTWLFDRESLQATNFWRVHRGEAAIDIGGSGGAGGEIGNPASDRFDKGKKPVYSAFR